MHRFLVEEGAKQASIEDVTSQALPLLTDAAKPERLENDWITNFFDKSRIISDSQMQQLWSRLLAGEANVPGTFSRRTVNLISDLDKRDAELFASLSQFACLVGDFTPLVFDFDEEPQMRHGITFASLSHLEFLGLIQLSTLGGFSRAKLPEKFAVSYFETRVTITLPPSAGDSIGIGHVLFTKAGKELFTISGERAVDGFLDSVCDRWKREGLTIESA